MTFCLTQEPPVIGSVGVHHFHKLPTCFPQWLYHSAVLPVTCAFLSSTPPLPFGGIFHLPGGPQHFSARGGLLAINSPSFCGLKCISVNIWKTFLLCIKVNLAVPFSLTILFHCPLTCIGFDQESAILVSVRGLAAPPPPRHLPRPLGLSSARFDRFYQFEKLPRSVLMFCISSTVLSCRVSNYVYIWLF